MEGDAGDRLSAAVVPSAYRLTLEPDVDTATFAGRVEIDVHLGAPSTVVELHALELAIDDAAITLPGGARHGADVTLDAARERAALGFGHALPVGPATLHLSFHGVLNDQLRGFYRTTYEDASGTHVVATTQLCETDARRAFPCFDEPAFKATFELTAVVPAGAHAYSNTEVARESRRADGRREVVFAPTITMSSYLVALVVGSLVRTDPVDAGGVPLAVVCPPGKEHLAEFALEVGAAALAFYADYFGTPYPGDKVDLVAIPDFAHGAMENLGCVTFRESRLLVDPATASHDELLSVASVVAHELAHMWFGDLVTMAWWEGIWLNEAFATFLSYVCVDAIRPAWRVWEHFAQMRGIGLEIDGLHTTRAIEFPVRTPEETLAMFDVITYLKGASVLRMLEQYLGEDVFCDGIRRYLATHAYGNTVTEDLWQALQVVSGEPVGSIMDTWIRQGGHPVVHARAGRLSQSPFVFGPSPDGASAIGGRWRVPVLLRPLGGGVGVAQLLDDDAPQRVAAPAVVNAGGAGTYRCDYATGELAALAGNVDALTPIERAVLLDDTWALVRAGAHDVDDLLVLARSLGTHLEPGSWTVVDTVLSTLDRVVAEADRGALESAAAGLLAPLLDALGWDADRGEDHDRALVRAIAVRGLGCVARDPAVRKEAAARFDAGELHGDLAAPILAVVASLDRRGDADELLARYRATDDAQAKERYQDAIAALEDPFHAVATFERCFELFRLQDAPYVVSRLLANRRGGLAVWDALTSEWDATIARVPDAMQAPMLNGISTFVDATAADRVVAFHRAHPIAAGQQRVEQSLERMRHRVAFAERVRPTLGAALAGPGGTVAG